MKDGHSTAYPVKDVSAQEDRKGNIWLAWDGGLGQFQDGRLKHYAASQDFVFSENTSFYEDREGNLWIGASNGLYRAREAAIKVFTRRDGLSFDNVYSIYEDRAGRLWFGTWGDGVTKIKDGCVTHYRMKEGLASDFITTLYEDLDGNMWIGTASGLHRLGQYLLSDCNRKPRKGSRLSAYPDPDGLFRQGVWVIHQDRAGRFWFGTSDGLIKHEGGRYTRYTTTDGIAGNDVRAILEDRTGRLWFGTWGGLSRFDDGRFTSYTEQDGLASDHIRALYEDAEGILWIGTYDGGLSRLKDGRFTRYTTKDGLFNNGVFQILEDGRGYFWLSCNKGIYRVRRQELNDFADGKARSITSVAYGKDDGLLSVECNGGRQPAGWKTRGGRLWFPTAHVNGLQHGFSLIGGNFTTIDFPNGINTGAFGINNAGVIVGGYFTGDDLSHGFKLVGGSFTAINAPSAMDTGAFGINNADIIVGGYSSDGNFVNGFKLSGSSFTTINFPGASDTGVFGINNLGDIVGVYQLNNVAHGFRLLAGTPTPTPTPSPTPMTIQFASAAASVSEGGGNATVTVNRLGDNSGVATVDYATSDLAGLANCNLLNSGNASSRCDYATAIGRLHFAAGETSKTISVLVVDDGYGEGNEQFNITLSNAVGASLGAPGTATVTINDNETVNGGNPLDQAGFFAREHYLDFFSREPDPSGLAFWTNQITECGTDAACVEIRRINVSAAFFLSIEFQQTGYLVYRMYKAAYGNLPGGAPVPVRFNEFLPDTQQIGL